MWCCICPRRRRAGNAVRAGFLVLILLCIWPQIIAWPLFPADQIGLSGTWESNPIGANRIYLIFTCRNVRIQPKDCCKSPSNYTISTTDDAIVYADSQQQQSYSIGKSLESFFITGDQLQITMMIRSPGPIPI